MHPDSALRPGYGPLRDELQDGRLGLVWGDAYAYAFADYPDKPFEGSVSGDLLETSVTYNIIEPMIKLWLLRPLVP